MCDLWPWKSEDRAAHSNYFDPFASKVHKNMHLQLKIENKEKYSIAIQSLHIYMYALHLQSLTRGVEEDSCLWLQRRHIARADAFT